MLPVDWEIPQSHDQTSSNRSCDCVASEFFGWKRWMNAEINMNWHDLGSRFLCTCTFYVSMYFLCIWPLCYSQPTGHHLAKLPWGWAIFNIFNMCSTAEPELHVTRALAIFNWLAKSGASRGARAIWPWSQSGQCPWLSSSSPVCGYRQFWSSAANFKMCWPTHAFALLGWLAKIRLG